MIGNFTLREIRNLLDNENPSSVILSKIVCSEYWDNKPYSSNDLDKLDARSWEVAMEIMSYRMNPKRIDAEIHAIASWCRTRHNLTDWSDRA